MSDGIIFAELHMAYGEQQESSDLVGVAQSPRFSLFKRRRGQLFTVVEPSLPGTENLCRLMIQTIEDEYFRDSSRTVTSSLRQALSMATETLRVENAKSSDRQLRVGISCAAIRGSEVYIAQIAPGTAFIIHNNSVKRVFSTHALMLEGGNDDGRDSDPLDVILEPQVSFAYSPLAEGDVIVLASGANWKLIPEKQILDAGKHIDPEMAATDLYGHYLAHARRPTTSLMVIRVSQLPVRKRRDVTERAAKPVARSDSRVEAVPDATPQVKGSPRVGGRLDVERSGGSPSVDSGPSGHPIPGTRPAVETRVKQTQSEQSTSRPAERPTPWRQLPPTADRGRRPIYPPGPALEPVGKPSVKLRDGWSQSRAERSPLLGLLLKIVLMLVLAAFFVVVGRAAIGMWESWQLGDPAVLLEEAELKRGQASGEGDPSAARAMLVESHDLLNRSLRAGAGESTRELISSVQSDIDRIDQTVRISDARVVVDYSDIADEKWDIARLLIDGGNLYVLDEGMDRIFLYALESNGEALQDSSKHPVLVKRGDKVDGGVIGDLLSLTWMPAGQLRTAPAMFALESGRSIVAHDPKLGLSRIEVTESQRWGNIQAVSGFAGGLYLLDTKQQGVFYYPPTKNGYESQPYTIVDSKSRIDLSRALDIALDGNLYLLGDEGEIARFSREGRPLEFDGKLPDGPMKGASGLFASANTRSLYVIDTEAERIVQFSPDGTLQRQFKADGVNVSFRDLRDVFVDEASRKAYVLAHKSLFVFDLPPMQ